MGRKAERGQRVVHSKTGQSGVIVSVLRGTVRVLFDNGTERIVQGSSLHSAKPGCRLFASLLLFAPFLALLSWGIAAYGPP